MPFKYPCHHYSSLSLFIIQMSGFIKQTILLRNNETCFVLCCSRPLYPNVRNVGGKVRISAVLWKRFFFSSPLCIQTKHGNRWVSGNLKLLVNINHLFITCHVLYLASLPASSTSLVAESCCHAFEVAVTWMYSLTWLSPTFVFTMQFILLLLTKKKPNQPTNQQKKTNSIALLEQLYHKDKA